VLSRYGRTNADARRAWQILLETVYDGPHYTRSIIDQVPHVRAAAKLPYDDAKLAEAWAALLAAANELGGVDTFRFDLVNVTRQVLSNHAAALHGAVVRAWQAKDAPALRKASEQFLPLIRDLDRLLGTREEFLLGRWLEDAKRWGTTDAERARFEWNARRVLTMWGQGASLDDYARKEWSGMVSGYYGLRWVSFLGESDASLANSRPFDEKEFQSRLRHWMDRWSDHQDTYPTQPQGDSVEVAETLWAKYKTQLARL
jgi:alpha-N-acetylglucosaminidase